MTPTIVANVEVFVNKDRRVTVQVVAHQFSIGKALAHQILHQKKKKLGKSNISARWVPKQVKEDQKASSVTIAKEHFSKVAEKLFFSQPYIFHSTFYSWALQFREGWTSVRDKALAHQILHQKKKKLGKSNISARWVPKQVKEDQKASSVTIAKEHFSKVAEKLFFSQPYIFHSTFYSWALQFREGWTSVRDKALAHQILHQKKKKLGKSNINARWVPKQVKEDQKASSVTIAKEHSGCFNYDENKFSNYIVT